jgi:antirestriction protein ArdC
MKIDIYRTVTEKIITAMEANDASWLRPYKGGVARNAVTGKDYQGVNILLLWASGGLNEFTSNEWATFKQWKSIDCAVKKGSKGSLIVFYKMLTSIDKDTKEEKSFPLLKYSNVFNAAQVDGYSPSTAEQTAFPVEALEQYAANTKAVIKSGPRPCYIPSQDKINMPTISDFYDTAGYYSTLFHELGHWTGTKERCNRDLKGRFGDQSYAMEELIAELCSAFTCAKTGIEKEPRADHAKYLNSWITILKADKKAIFTASKQATLASEYLDALQPSEQLKAA